MINLIIKKRLVINHIRLNGPNAGYLQCMAFLRQNFETIKAFIESLSGGRPIKISSKAASLSLAHKDGGVSYVIINSVSEIKNKVLSGSGSIKLEYDPANKHTDTKQDFGTQPLRYNLKGYLLKSGLNMENIELKNDDFYMKLWGIFENGTFRLHGFASLSNFFKAQAARKSSRAIIKQFKAMLSKKHDPFQAMLNSKSSLNIGYINCLMKITPLSLQLENLSFSVNNIPLRLKGSIGLTPPASIDLTLFSYPYQLKKLRAANPRRFDLKVMGDITEGGFNGRMWIEFLRRSKKTALVARSFTIQRVKACG